MKMMSTNSETLYLYVELITPVTIGTTIVFIKELVQILLINS